MNYFTSDNAIEKGKLWIQLICLKDKQMTCCKMKESILLFVIALVSMSFSTEVAEMFERQLNVSPSAYCEIHWWCVTCFQSSTLEFWVKLICQSDKQMICCKMKATILPFVTAQLFVLKPLKAWFSIETRLKRFSGLKRSGFKLLPHYFIGRSNIVSYDHTTWWLLW